MNVFDDERLSQLKRDELRQIRSDRRKNRHIKRKEISDLGIVILL